MNDRFYPNVPYFSPWSGPEYRYSRDYKRINSLIGWLRIANILLFLTTLLLFSYGVIIYVKEYGNLIINVSNTIYAIFTGIQVILILLTSIIHCGKLQTMEALQILNADVVNATAIFFSTWHYAITTLVFLVYKEKLFCGAHWINIKKKDLLLFSAGVLVYILHVLSILLSYYIKFLLVKYCNQPVNNNLMLNSSSKLQTNEENNQDDCHKGNNESMKDLECNDSKDDFQFLKKEKDNNVEIFY